MSDTTTPTTRAAAMQDRIQSLRLPTPGSPAPGGPAPGKTSTLPWFLCVVFFCTSVALGYLVVSGTSLKPSDAEVESLKNATKSEPTPSTTTPAEPAAGTILLESKGYIVPAHQILVSPKVSGMILKLHFDKLREGQRVPAGAPLAEIESVEYQADANRARANFDLASHRLQELVNGSRPGEIEEAWNQWQEAEEQATQLKKTYERNVELRGRNVLSPQEFDQSRADYLAAQKRAQRWQATWKLAKEGPRKERIEASSAERDLARAEKDKAEWRLANCTIRAPISGTILKKNAEEGNVVNPVAFNGSFSLCEMADLSDLEVDLSIQERDVSRVFERQRCRVRSEAFRDRPYDGYVSRLMPIADRAKGAVPVRVKIRVPKEEEGQYLKPEMGAIVEFLSDKVDPREFAAPHSSNESATPDSNSEPIKSSPEKNSSTGIDRPLEPDFAEPSDFSSAHTRRRSG